MFIKLIFSILIAIIISLIFDTRNLFFDFSEFFLSSDGFKGHSFESGVAYLLTGIFITALLANTFKTYATLTEIGN